MLNSRAPPRVSRPLRKRKLDNTGGLLEYTRQKAHTGYVQQHPSKAASGKFTSNCPTNTLTSLLASALQTASSTQT